MIRRLINRPCTIHRQEVTEETDDMGDPIVADADAGHRTVCDLQQNTADENRDGGAGSQTSTWSLFLLPEESLDGWDEITVAPPDADPETWDGVGTRMTLYGEPWPVRNPRTGVVSHIEATVHKIA